MTKSTIINSFFYKSSACFLMLIDHIGAFLFPNVIILRIIGRLALPLFAYQFTIGLKNSSNLNNQSKRLLLFALISQIPYYFLTWGASGQIRLNILFTLLLSSIFLRLWRSGRYRILALLLLPIFYWCDYSYYGLAMILMMNYIHNWHAGLLILNAIYIVFSGVFIQLFSSISYYLIKLIDRISLSKYLTRFDPSRFKHIFYIFYPAHLLLILIIRLTYNYICRII